MKMIIGRDAADWVEACGIENPEADELRRGVAL